ncbi:hypothetical protein [Clostridium oryzae]|uniref:N-acetyltransferase domain-containing protein n=1 Tax=Clostridium oryzae TaxID=1450648 RepID=A0A1V4IXU0_9CLOT|nr:hypothetical protein [Clostridium oryzae]OPJ64892.1 hypothetical protein CLORY_04010 [Clostridium oryzae]
MSDKIILRDLNEYDWDVIEESFRREGWQKDLESYKQYFDYMKQGICSIIIAQWLEDFAGVLVINWQSEYENFKEREIPEISDIRVVHKFMRSSVYDELMDEAEKRIFQKKDTAGIGISLAAEYSQTHILCIKRGYIPDGTGIYKQNKQLQLGQQIIFDEKLKMYMIKNCDKKIAYKKGAIRKLENIYYDIYKGKL